MFWSRDLFLCFREMLPDSQAVLRRSESYSRLMAEVEKNVRETDESFILKDRHLGLRCY